MNLVAVPAVKRRHHRHNTRLDGGHIALTVDRHQITFTQPSITLIDTTVRAPIADKVLSGGDDTFCLHRLYYATGERFNESGLGAI